MKLKALLAVALVAAIVTGSTEIEKGVTVTLAGGDASIAIGAGAGIEVPRGAALNGKTRMMGLGRRRTGAVSQNV